MRHVLFFILITAQLNAQEFLINGKVLDSLDRSPIANASIRCMQHDRVSYTGAEGAYSIYLQGGGCRLRFSAPGYRDHLLPIQDEILGLRIALLPLSLPVSDWEEVAGEGGDLVFLGSGWDLLQRRIAFDLGQAFFRPRGMDSREQAVYLNGFRMNYPTNGRVNWSDWGGLNDVLRSREIHYGLHRDAAAESGALGSVHMSSDPLAHRPGLRFSSSYSDRTYRGRLMLTYNKSGADRLLSYSASGSLRRGNSGYMQATPYQSYAAFLGLNFKISRAASLQLYGLRTGTIRGRSAAVTQEARNLLGMRYNPNWGVDDGSVRNAKMRERQSDLLQGFLTVKQGNLHFTLGAAYQLSRWGDSRLAYLNAPNPDPVYYRYLPSYYANSPSLPNPYNAYLNQAALRDRPQLDWQALRIANQAPYLKGKAAYLQVTDVLKQERHWVQSTVFYRRPHWRMGGGFTLQKHTAQEYGLLTDLLEAEYHEDIDPFSGNAFDLDGPEKKVVGDRVNHNLQFSASVWRAWMEWEYGMGRWGLLCKAVIHQRRDKREGLFANAAFPETSQGSGPGLNWNTSLYRVHLTYAPDQRQQLSLGGLYSSRPPVLDAVWLDRRQSNQLLPISQKELVSGLELGYKLRMNQFTGSATIYQATLHTMPPVRAFYAESGLGNGFYRMSRGRTAQLHRGMELAGEYEWMNGVKLNAIVSHGTYSFDSDPQTWLYPDAAQEPLESGMARLHDEPLGGGPTTAISVGAEYRHPARWFAGITMNHLQGGRLQPAILRRTDSFQQTTGPEFLGLPSRLLPAVFLVNMLCGKSWLRGRTYISLFGSLSNVLNFKYLSGGFEQERKATFKSWIQDQASGQPRFGPKYWSGYGRTVFLNLALSIR